MKVRNVPKRSVKLPAGYKNWLDYWQEKMGTRATKCGFLACPHEATLAMVVEEYGKSGKLYILPECYTCSLLPTTEYYLVKEKMLLEL